MAEKEKENAPEAAESAIVEPGEVSTWLTEQGFGHEVMEKDHQGVEILKVEPQFLLPFATALYAYGLTLYAAKAPTTLALVRS